jgi:hypothetical protein
MPVRNTVVSALNEHYDQCKNKLQTWPLVREGAPQRQDSNIQTTTFGQKLISGHKSQSGLETLTYRLTGR